MRIQTVLSAAALVVLSLAPARAADPSQNPGLTPFPAPFRDPTCVGNPALCLPSKYDNFPGGCNVAVPLACPKTAESKNEVFKTDEVALPPGWFYTFVENPPKLHKPNGDIASPAELRNELARIKDAERAKAEAAAKAEADRIAAQQKTDCGMWPGGEGCKKPDAPKPPGATGDKPRTPSDTPGGRGFLAKSGSGAAPPDGAKSVNSLYDDWSGLSGGGGGEGPGSAGSGSGPGQSIGSSQPKVVGVRVEGPTRSPVKGTWTSLEENAPKALKRAEERAGQLNKDNQDTTEVAPQGTRLFGQ